MSEEICSFLRKRREDLESKDIRRLARLDIEFQDECEGKGIDLEKCYEMSSEAFGMIHELEHCPSGKERTDPRICMEGVDGLLSLIKALSKCRV